MDLTGENYHRVRAASDTNVFVAARAIKDTESETINGSALNRVRDIGIECLADCTSIVLFYRF